MSAARLTTPKPTTARHGDQAGTVSAGAASATSCSAVGGPPAASDTALPSATPHGRDESLLHCVVVSRYVVAPTHQEPVAHGHPHPPRRLASARRQFSRASHRPAARCRR